MNCERYDFCGGDVSSFSATAWGSHQEVWFIPRNLFFWGLF